MLNYIDPEEEYAKKERAAIVFDCLVMLIKFEMLRPRDYAVLELRFRDGKTYKEIGEKLGISAARVPQIIQNVIWKLRDSGEFRRRIEGLV